MSSLKVIFFILLLIRFYYLKMNKENDVEMGDNEASSDAATPHQSRPRKRCRTEHEKRERNLSERKLLMPCNDCKLKCSESYSEHYRGQILSGYWSLNHRERRQWLDGHIRIGEVQRRRLSDQVNITKERSNTYYLPKNGFSQRVCKTVSGGMPVGHMPV